MRLLHLELQAYGAFSNTGFPLRSDALLHVLVGPNEAGKSTRRRAIADLLFGIPHSGEELRYEFLHGSKMSIAACIESDGTLHDVVRRKGRGHTLHDRGGTAVDATRVLSWTSTFDRLMYERLFSISQRELGDGARMLLEDDGAVQSALYGAATGGFDVRALLRELETRKTEIFTPRAQNKPLNAALTAFAGAMSRRDKNTTDTHRWQELETEAARLEREIDSMGEHLNALEHAREVVQRALEAAPKLEELAARVYECDMLSRQTHVPQESITELAELVRALGEKTLLADQGMEDVIKLRAEQEDARVDQLLLESHAEIDALSREIGTVRKALAALTGDKLDEVRDAALREVESTILQLWPGASLDEVRARKAAVIESLPKARRTLRSYAELERELALTGARIREKRTQLERTIVELTRLGPAVDNAPLAAVLAEVERIGHIDDQAGILAAKIAAQAEYLSAELHALRITHDEPLACRNLVLPLRARVEDLRRRFESLAAREEHAASTIGSARAAVDERCISLARLCEAGGGASLQGLQMLRSGRDCSFEGMLAAVRAKPNAEVEINDYRVLVAQADTYADERFEHASEIAQATLEERELKRAQAALAQAQERQRALLEERRAIEGEWLALRSPSFELARTPEELLEFLERAGRAVTVAHSIVEQREQHAQLILESARLIGMLRESMANNAPQSATLGTLVQLARTHLKTATAMETNRDAAAKRQAELWLALKEDEASREQELANFRRWEAEWKQVTAPLMPAATPLAPGDAGDTLSEIAKLFKTLDGYDEMQKRIEGIVRERDDFIARASAAIERCAPDLALLLARDPLDSIAQLCARAKATYETFLGNEQRGREIARKESELAKIRAEIAHGELRRDAVLKASGIALVDLDEALARGRKCGTLRADIERLQCEIGLSARREPEEVQRQIDEHGGVGGVQREIDRLRCDIQETTERWQKLLETRGAQQSDLQRIRTSNQAVDAQAEAMAIGVEIDNHARRYAALTIASTILTERMEAYAAAHQGPVIEAASRYLAAMTLGRYAAVRIVENDKGQPAFEIVGPEGCEKQIKALSAGTEDLLYLALRLATLEERLQGTVGPPLLLDDALQNFDDDRTVATLAALGNFSRFAQVIYFTPRTVVADLARKALGENVDIIHLGASA